MLRRFAASAHVSAVMATPLAVCASSFRRTLFTRSNTQHQASDHVQAESNHGSNSNYRNNSNHSASSSSSHSGSPASRPRANRANRPPLPPAFDVVHWNDDDITRGHLLRIIHRDSFIVLDYHRQSRRSGEEGGATAGGGNRAERVVTVNLPPVYIARLLGVLEGRLERVDVQSRFTNASFTPDATRGAHHHSLKCVSMRPTTGQQQSIDGTDVNEESIEWQVDFDAAESLMLQRFLTEALRYNSGFARRSAQP